MRILLINGPNLNLLGKRQPEIYGNASLWDLENTLKAKFPSVKFEFIQSNHEGALIDALQKGMDGMTDGVIINPGAYAHTSYAIRDAVTALKIPVVEVHITNVHAREEFRHTSVIAPACTGVIAGLGMQGYELAVTFHIDYAGRKGK
ncbi:MAG: type II 3-dehydroquinate dehydratase [Ignavibacteria bacterium RIFCSPLOWO2_02_FULL_55_14]|nr:MAG: type II 3-dehydroquinate dehydratase [Ignavibacteria bacterium GWC2_56_12]OGU70986.1 MAG: type II 3-dehydroquinate dehydratase [Ignavibacteria bacterium RIFCSPLOWO2_02_FULL_55_14]